MLRKTLVALSLIAVAMQSLAPAEPFARNGRGRCNTSTSNNAAIP